MKSGVISTAVVIGVMAALAAGDVFAAGRGNGGGGGKRSGTCPTVQTAIGGVSTTRPIDSQRRDGTFLTTGTTANGSTTRPGNGKGLQDGSRLATTAVPTTTP